MSTKTLWERFASNVSTQFDYSSTPGGNRNQAQDALGITTTAAYTALSLGAGEALIKGAGLELFSKQNYFHTLN